MASTEYKELLKEVRKHHDGLRQKTEAAHGKIIKDKTHFFGKITLGESEEHEGKYKYILDTENISKIMQGVHPSELDIDRVVVKFDGSPHVDHVQWYGVDLTHSKGTCTIVDKTKDDKHTITHVICPDHNTFSGNFSNFNSDHFKTRREHGFTRPSDLTRHVQAADKTSETVKIPVFANGHVFPAISLSSALVTGTNFHSCTAGKVVPAIQVKWDELKELQNKLSEADAYEEKALCIQTSTSDPIVFEIEIYFDPKSLHVMAQTSVMELLPSEHEGDNDDELKDTGVIEKAAHDILESLVPELLVITNPETQQEKFSVKAFQPAPNSRKAWERFMELPGFFHSLSKSKQADEKLTFENVLKNLSGKYLVVGAAAEFFAEALDYYGRIATDQGHDNKHVASIDDEELNVQDVPKHIKDLDCRGKNSLCKLIHIIDIYILCLLQSCWTTRRENMESRDQTTYEKVITELFKSFESTIKSGNTTILQDPHHHLYNITHQKFVGDDEDEGFSIMDRARIAKGKFLKNTSMPIPYFEETALHSASAQF